MTKTALNHNILQLEPIQNSSCVRGFWNLFQKENTVWWKTKRWLILGLTSILLTNGFVQLMMLTNPKVEMVNGVAVSQTKIAQEPHFEIFMVYAFLVSIITTISIMQGAIIDERKSGTMGWILSKPATRKAFVLSKLLCNLFGVFFLTIFIPASIYVFQRSQMNIPIAPDKIVFAVLLLGVDLMFYLSLSILAGVIVKSRKAVLGITLGYFFIRMFMNSTASSLSTSKILPPGFLLPQIIALENSDMKYINEVWTMVFISLSLTIIFIAISLYVFEREEI